MAIDHLFDEADREEADAPEDVQKNRDALFNWQERQKTRWYRKEPA